MHDHTLVTDPTLHPTNPHITPRIECIYRPFNTIISNLMDPLALTGKLDGVQTRTAVLSTNSTLLNSYSNPPEPNASRGLVLLFVGFWFEDKYEYDIEDLL